MGCISQGFSQQKESVNHFTLLKHLAIPVSLIIYGITLSGHESKELELSLHQKFPLFKSHLDDYAQYIPIGAFLIDGPLGLNPQNNLKSRAVYTAISYGTMAITINILKRAIHEQRPDLSDYNSFPSGHTATAFAGAELFHQELKYSHPILSYAAFPIAVGVGSFRMLNNKHYLSDVLVGAGIGILSTKLAYGIYHPQLNNHKESKLSLNFSPTKVMGESGFALSGRF
jgi:membrane-associated phospholipid phosphatase